METAEGLAERLDRLEAHSDIQQLVARYAVGADANNDPAILGPLFAEDATWEAPGMVERITGRERIARRLGELGQTFILWSLHFMNAPVITLDPGGQHGQCRWYLWEICTMRDADGQVRDTWIGGWYDATVTRSERGWVFKQVVLDTRLVSPLEAPLSGKVTRQEARTETLVPMRRVTLCRIDDLSPGEIRRVEVEGTGGIAVYNLSGEFFATADLCTHGEASLSEGEIEGDRIVCPYHLGEFCIRTGEAVGPPCVDPLETFEVVIEARDVIALVPG